MSFIIRVNRGLKDINMTAHTEQYVDRMVEDRRSFHMNPEQGWLEFETTGRPGPVTTLRFDIDCLAIEELFDAIKLDQKTLEATFARYNELTQPARTPTSAVASTRKQSRSAKRPSTSPK